MISWQVLCLGLCAILVQRTAGCGGGSGGDGGGQPDLSDCGNPEVKQGRVIAGQNAKKGAWPWQVLMLHNGRPMCGGSLIAPRWVVTAAHCVSGRESQTSSFTIRAGEHIFTTTQDGSHQDLRVSKIISHPSYSGSNLNNDIALIQLKSPAMFNKYVKPVCIPKQNQDVPVGTQCYITGWGKIQHPGNMHHTLQQGKIPVVSNSACANLNTRNFRIKITDQMVCAGHGGKTRLSGCHGDSGGPFVCQTGANGRWVLHGAVSWGSGRCDATQGYTVFARVAKFRNWIEKELKAN